MRIALLRLLAALFLFPCLAVLPACNTLGGPPIISQTLDEKALYVAELSYAGGLASVEAAVDSGHLKGEDAIRAGNILDQANSAIVLARSAYATGDSLQAVLSVQEAYSSLAELQSLAPPGLAL